MRHGVGINGGNGMKCALSTYVKKAGNPGDLSGQQLISSDKEKKKAQWVSDSRDLPRIHHHDHNDKQRSIVSQPLPCWAAGGDSSKSI